MPRTIVTEPPEFVTPAPSVADHGTGCNTVPKTTKVIALDALRAGVSVIPVKADGSKAPALRSWKPYQTTPATPDEVEGWFQNPATGLGYVCGRVSRNLECVDFDDRDTYQAYRARAIEVGIGPLVEKIETGFLEHTPNGVRWAYRCDVIGGSQKLAGRRTSSDGGGGVKTLIETKGEGGYFIAAPSNGTVHPTGRPYRSVRGGPETIVTLTQEERDDIHGLARTFDLTQRRPATSGADNRADVGLRPGDDLASRTLSPEILEPAGWRLIYERDEVWYWRRPGKDTGISATTNYAGIDLFYPFTTSTEFDANRAYDKFAVFTILNHNGDFKAAARDLAGHGYGSATHIHLVGAGSAIPGIHSAPYRENVVAERKLRFRTAAEIEREAPTSPGWIAEPWVAANAVSAVDGKPKSAGKTIWLLHLIAAVLDGDQFMGWPTTKTPVVYLTEEGEATFREALQRAGLLGRDDLHVLNRSDAWGAPWPEVVTAAVNKCQEVGAHLLVVDTVAPFAGLRGDKENNAGDQQEAFEPLARARDHGLAVVASRHERKSSGEVGDLARGSNAFTAAADVIISIRRPEGHCQRTIREIHALSRFSEAPDKLTIELTDDGYEVRDSAAVSVGQAEDAILSIAPAEPDDALTIENIVTKSGVGRTTAQKAIQHLIGQGRLTGAGRGVKNDPRRYHRPIHSATTTSSIGAQRNREDAPGPPTTEETPPRGNVSASQPEEPTCIE